MSKRETQRLAKELEKWKQVLRLQDWDVALYFVSAEELHNSEVYADIKVHEHHKQAKIRLLKPNEKFTTFLGTYRPEFFLIHELLHLHFWPLGVKADTNNINTAEEQAINAIAEAFYRLAYEQE